MATESDGGLFAQAETIGFFGSSMLESSMYKNVKNPIGYGLNRIIKGADKAAQNRYMFGTQLWQHYKPRRYGINRYHNINKTPDLFESVVRKGSKYKSLSESAAASFLNKATSSQYRYASKRSAEAVRRLAARTIITRGGKAKAAGYLNRSIWKMTAKKPLARMALKKAAVGQLAKGAHKIFKAGWGAGLLYEVGSATVKLLRQQARDSKSMDWGKGFEMTEGMYTERQRAVQAITSSRMSTRSAIGGEAAMMHR